MDYASFSIEDIRLLSENLANRTEWIDILFSKLRYQVNIPLEAAERCLISTVIGIMNGTTLEEAFEAISEWSNGKSDNCGKVQKSGWQFLELCWNWNCLC